MIRTLFAMTVALAAATLPAQATEIQRVVSPGGIEAWLVEEHAIPVVATAFAFRGGASQDPTGKAGLSSLMSSLLDEGAGELDAAAFQERLEETAVELSFRAERDQFSGTMRTLADNMDEGFRLLGLALTAPRFEQEAVDRIRAQVTARLRRDARDPGDIAGRAFMATAFPDHPYGLPVRGTEGSLAAVTRDDLATAAKRQLARDNLVIGVVGAIDAKTLGTKLDETFGRLPANSELVAVADTVPKLPGAPRVVELPVPQTTIMLGRPGPLRKDDDFIPGFVLNHILGGGSFSSRLFTEVREKRGLAYSVYSYLAPYQHAGLFMGGVATRNDRAAETLALIRDEIRRIAADGPTDVELAKAKQYLIGSYALRFDTSTKIADQLVALQVDDLGIDYINKRNDLIAAVSRDDIKRSAAKLLADGDLLVIAVGQPTGFDDAVRIAAPTSAAAVGGKQGVPAATRAVQ